MNEYKAEKNADLIFSFPDSLEYSELDQQGVKLPVNMKFVDLVIEREHDTLLIEIKDPSNGASPREERKKYFKRLTNNNILSQELVPKARDSYCYLHLMEQDSKPFKFIVIMGLDAFEVNEQKTVLTGFKDRLLANIRCESHEPWRRKHIEDCAVFSIETWNQNFPEWQVERISSTLEKEGSQ